MNRTVTLSRPAHFAGLSWVLSAPGPDGRYEAVAPCGCVRHLRGSRMGGYETGVYGLCEEHSLPDDGENSGPCHHPAPYQGVGTAGPHACSYCEAGPCICGCPVCGAENPVDCECDLEPDGPELRCVRCGGLGEECECPRGDDYPESDIPF